MEFSPNSVLVRFNGEHIVPPTTWNSRQAQALYEAGEAAERASNDWQTRGLSGTIKVGPRAPSHPDRIAYGTTPEAAAALIRGKIADLRRRADLMEAALASDGATAFIDEAEAIRAPVGPADAEQFLLSVLRRDWSEITVNGVVFRRDTSGSAKRVS